MTIRIARSGRTAGNQFWGCVDYPNCRGSLNLDGSIPGRPTKPPVAKRTPVDRSAKAEAANQTTVTSSRSGKRVQKAPIRPGDLLVSTTNALGPGKALGNDGDNLILEYFDTPGQKPDERKRLSVPRSSLSRFVLKQETRVFFVATGKWRSGRVIETTSHRDIHVRAHEWEGFVPEKDLFIRCHIPLTDPVGFGAGGLLESPLLADLRRPYLQAILQQRSVARGMKGALSSAIELHDHQLAAAWRVLQDPVQRYLLADEVGLGKTVEAGIILRQLLLDNPGLSVQLILPPFLVGQWRHELTNKFFLNDFTKADIRFARNDEPSTWAPADLLIVDEVHNLAGLAYSDQPHLAERYSTLAKIATDSPKLLMLSATPALNNEPVFLQMLKLLDPAVYGDVSVGDLRNRLDSRVRLGRIMLGLQPNLPSMLLLNRVRDLRTALLGDTDAEQLLDIATEALNSNDRDKLTAAIDDIRMHVAEIYRVHRRMLRTRRTFALQATYRVTGRKAPEALILKSELLAETTRLLEAWRQEVLAAHEEHPSELRTAARSFAEAVSLSLDPEALAVWARSRMAATPGEQTALDRIVQDLMFTRRRDAVAQPVADALSYLFNDKEKVVIFCPTTDLVTELAEELREYLPATAVLEHRATDLPERIDWAIQKFESTRETAVLIADSSAEEGRNFQFADLLVHVGVQSDANRMEQRLGRCDRWQMNDTAGTWRSLVIAEADASATFVSTWTRVLQEGFGVFDSSIASVQLAVEAATDKAWQHLLTDGVNATDAIIKAVRAALVEEVERIREQDALDSIESKGENGSLYRQLAAFESSEAEFAELTHALLSTNHVPGNLRFRSIGDPVHAVGGYDPLSRLPGQQLQVPLVSLERLERDFLPIRNQRGTYLRNVAIEHADTHLYRYGDPFIEAVSDFLWHDDRGRAFGMWRWLPNWAYGEQIAYRFDYALEAKPQDDESQELRSNKSTLDDTAARNTLMHRADGLFSPLIVTVWVDECGRQLTDSNLLAALQEPYAKPVDKPSGGDFSLNRSRIEAAYKYVPATEWSQRWHAAEDAAVNLVWDLHEVRDTIATGLRQAQSDSAKRVKQLKMRAVRAAGNERAALNIEITLEEAAGQSLIAAIKTPTFRLDSTGIVIVSGEELQMDNDG